MANLISLKSADWFNPSAVKSSWIAILKTQYSWAHSYHWKPDALFLEIAFSHFHVLVHLARFWQNGDKRRQKRWQNGDKGNKNQNHPKSVWKKSFINKEIELNLFNFGSFFGFARFCFHTFAWFSKQKRNNSLSSIWILQYNFYIC